MLLKKAAITPTPRRAKTRPLPDQGRSRKQPEAYPLGYVEDCFDPRMKLGKRRVLARLGVGGCNVAFFSSMRLQIVLPIQAAILYRFGDVWRLDLLGVREIGNRTRDAQNSAIRTRGQ